MYRTVTVILILAQFANGKPQSPLQASNFEQNKRYASDYQSQTYDLRENAGFSYGSTDFGLPNKGSQENMGRYAPQYQPSTRNHHNQDGKSVNLVRVRLENGVIVISNAAGNATGERDYFQNRISQYAFDEIPGNIEWPSHTYKYNGPRPRIWTVDQLIEYIWLGGRNTTGMPIDTIDHITVGEELIPFIDGVLLTTLSGGNTGK